MASCHVWVCFAVVLTCCCLVKCAPGTLYLELVTPSNEEIAFMKRYGYLEAHEKSEEETYTAYSISEAVLKVQAFAGLPQTGELDAETKKLFKMKRCGVRDLHTKTRDKRYIIQSPWRKKRISYRVLNGARTLEKGRVEALVAAGLAVWAPHGGLQFEPVDSRADIELSFVTGDHGDGSPFDGPGNVVAHAFPPPLGGLHFDDDEIWGDSPDTEDDVTDFFAVAVHEIGHALGLSHSNVKASVMYPYYQVPVDKLHMDDILGMQMLYLNDTNNNIEKETTSPVLSHSSHLPSFTMTSEESEEFDEDDIPDLCYANYDTIQVLQGYLYVFEEEWVWKLSERRKIEPGYPKRFHDVFIGLPKSINTIRTIYEKRNGNIAIFHRKSFFEFDSSFRFKRRGKINEYGLPRYVHELSTVFLSNYNNKTYLIDSEKFWRYDEATSTMDRGYPKSMSAWRDLPYPIDSALIWKGDTFFFHGPRFWRFDNKYIRAHEYYPLPTAQIWFPCPSNEEMYRYMTNDDR